MRRNSASLAGLTIGLCLCGVPGLLAQDRPQDPQREQQIQNIIRDRPPQAEAAARAFLLVLSGRTTEHAPIYVIDGVPSAGEGPPAFPALDQLKARNPDAYWREVAQLNMQFEMLQRVIGRDSARARAMAAMFATEFDARVLQRSWRGADGNEQQRIRSRLETLMSRHFEAEDQLRALEVQDIRRRLAEVEAESERRRARRAEMVRWSVDDIIHGAERPEF